MFLFVCLLLLLLFLGGIVSELSNVQCHSLAVGVRGSAFQCQSLTDIAEIKLLVLVVVVCYTDESYEMYGKPQGGNILKAVIHTHPF